MMSASLRPMQGRTYARSRLAHTSLILALTALGTLFAILQTAAHAREHQLLTESAAPDDPASADAIVARVLASYASADSYAIEFSQESYWSLADSVSRSSARLVFRQPSLLSVSYEDGGRIVADEESLRVYVPATNQFFVSRIGASGVVLDPASILRHYEVDPNVPMVGASGSDDIVVLALRPRERPAEPVRVDVSIDRNAWTVAALTAYTTSGDRSSYRIESTLFDPTIGLDEFNLPRPEGSERYSGSPYDAGQIR